MPRWVRRLLLASAVAVFPLAAQAADLVTGLKPASPHPTADKLTPGLAVTYYFNVFNHTREIPDRAKYKDGVKGKPILILDYFVGDGDVLPSGRADEFGADIHDI